MHNKTSIIVGLKMIFKKNYKIDVDKFDYLHEIDFKNTYSENFYEVYEKLKNYGYIRGVNHVKG